MMEAVNNGFAQEINKSVTDQGITVTIENIITDPYQTVVIYNISRNGKILDNAKPECKDPKAGFAKILGKDGKQLSVHCMGDKYQTKNGPRPSVLLPAIKGAIPNQANLVFDINKIIHEDTKKTYKSTDAFKGKWKLEVPIDYIKALAATKTYQMDNTMCTSPDKKVTMQFKSLFNSPTNSIIKYQNEFSLQAKQEYKQILNLLNKDYASSEGTVQWYYQFLDKQNNVVLEANLKNSHPLSSFDSKTGKIVLSHTSPIDREQSKGIGKDTFIYQKNLKDLTIQVSGYTQEELVNKEVMLDPAKLEQQPLVFSHNGAQFTFKLTNKERFTDKGKKHTTQAISIDYKLSNGYTNLPPDLKIIQDGKEYIVGSMAYKNQSESKGVYTGTYYDLYSMDNTPLLVNPQKPIKLVIVGLERYQPVSCHMPLTLK